MEKYENIFIYLFVLCLLHAVQTLATDFPVSRETLAEEGKHDLGGGGVVVVVVVVGDDGGGGGGGVGAGVGSIPEMSHLYSIN